MNYFLALSFFIEDTESTNNVFISTYLPIIVAFIAFLVFIVAAIQLFLEITKPKLVCPDDAVSFYKYPDTEGFRYNSSPAYAHVSIEIDSKSKNVTTIKRAYIKIKNQKFCYGKLVTNYSLPTEHLRGGGNYQITAYTLLDVPYILNSGHSINAGFFFSGFEELIDKNKNIDVKLVIETNRKKSRVKISIPNLDTFS